MSSKQRRSHAFAWSYISMLADTSHSNHLFPPSKRCCAVEPVLRQIRSKHNDRCIHKNGSRGPGVCSDATINYLSTEQLSWLPFVYPPCCRVGEVEQRRLLGSKWDKMKLTRTGSEPKHNFWVWQWMSECKSLRKGVQKHFWAMFYWTDPLALCHILNILS